MPINSTWDDVEEDHKPYEGLGGVVASALNSTTVELNIPCQRYADFRSDAQAHHHIVWLLQL